LYELHFGRRIFLVERLLVERLLVERLLVERLLVERLLLDRRRLRVTRRIRLLEALFFLDRVRFFELFLLEDEDDREEERLGDRDCRPVLLLFNPR
jgi:hypothetical protein